MNKEIWKDVFGYESLYQISNWGRIKSLKFGKERIMKPGIDSNGYYHVCLSKDGVQKSRKIHKLVAIAFLGHIPDGHNIVVLHKNHNKLDNRVENLNLDTQRENCSDYRTDVGVCWDKNRNKYLSRIKINNNDVYLGVSTDKELAVQMYQKALANINLYQGDAKAFRNALKEL